MTLRMVALLALSTIIAAFESPSATALPSVQELDIAHTGCHHGYQVSARSGETWWAMYRRGDDYELAPRIVQITHEHDAVLDPIEDRTVKSGRCVAVEGDAEPLFLVWGRVDLGTEPVIIPSARRSDGGLGTAPPGKSRFLRPGERLTLTLEGGEYTLAAGGRYDPSRPEHDRLLLEYRLTLTGPGGASQVLPVPARFAEDGMPVLLWAGDLDRDGRLDLYMDVTYHYNLSDYALFLSSRAPAGLLVEKVASRRYTGC